MLSALGVDRQWLHLDLTGTWDEAARDVCRQTLVQSTGLSAGQISIKVRKDRHPSLSLTVGVDRGNEKVKAWSLTYTLILLDIFLQATACEVSDGRPASSDSHEPASG